MPETINLAKSNTPLPVVTRVFPALAMPRPAWPDSVSTTVLPSSSPTFSMLFAATFTAPAAVLPAPPRQMAPHRQNPMSLG